MKAEPGHGMELATPSQPSRTTGRDLTGASPAFVVAEPFQEALAVFGLTSLDAVFAFEAGRVLAKPNIGRHRRRLEFEIASTGCDHPVKVYLKRYDRPPILGQLGNWLSHHRRRSLARLECETADRLAAAGINTPRAVACGERWGTIFEHRSFLMTEEIKDSRSLESHLPPCFQGMLTSENRQARRDFIRQLASFIKRFHETGYRHRDLYLSHVFCSTEGEFCLIDLARASRPLLQRRFQIKDIAQLHYSASAEFFTRADRLRFYLAYVGRRRLLPQDKAFICAVVRKAYRMARHNRKRGNRVPFLGHGVSTKQ
jgi:tRNA A-37 threonylcarbamoyl transferase component Bud32